MTADCRDDKDIKKQKFGEQIAIGNMLVKKFLFSPIEAKILLGNEEFRYLGHAMPQTVEMIRILKNNSWGKMQLELCWSRSSYFLLLRQKSYCSSNIVTPFMDEAWNHSIIAELY